MLVTPGLCAGISKFAVDIRGAAHYALTRHKSRHRWGVLIVCLLLSMGTRPAFAQIESAYTPAPTQKSSSLPPRVVQAQRFLASRGIVSRPGTTVRTSMRPSAVAARPQSTSAADMWQPLGPLGVVSPSYGVITGRISALALDLADTTGNRLYAGTTGGGVWVSQNAGTSNPDTVVFTPLTDKPGALSGVFDASISIGAITVQPNGTGVILAGTGDPNDNLDSYYGGGILRSIDNGNNWSLIKGTSDHKFLFSGEGFAGFAWSTTHPDWVVAAVSQAWEGVLVSADWPAYSYEGLYYSTDSGATWSLARITDLNGQDVQGPLDAFTSPDGNAATSVVWNPIRKVFLAVVRFHGYYQSSDGANWTRLPVQPGAGLTTSLCPTRPVSPGSPGCPIYRGTLAVNPVTGDTFAWTVDLNNQDQGIWQDVCSASGNSCTNQNVVFGKQWNSAALETDTWQGAATLQDGSYNLALAAVPSSQDTILLAGGNDLWKCSLAMGCVWRNTTNSSSCASARVAEYQHVLEWWNPKDTQEIPEIFIGNDSGLWRSTDGINESGPVCSAGDATHFQNLNAGLGSLAEVESLSAVEASPDTMMVGLGVNGFAGVKSVTDPAASWPQILDGEGGPVAIDPTDPARWYANNGSGVSIHLCAQEDPCTPGDFGTAPVVTNADVSNDGLTMTSPAPFLVDPVDATQLLIGTCRLWRGPANGIGWNSSNAVGSMFDGNRTSPSCSGNALVSTMAAMALAGGGEIVYVGTYGSLNGGATLPGHVLSATMNAAGVWSSWRDLTLNPVTNDVVAMNSFGLEISSLFVDPHDPTGNTIYAMIAGAPNSMQNVCVVYRSIDGGAHWFNLRSNLVYPPANSLVIDPQDANTAYLATDIGVYFTRNVGSCTSGPASCWSPLGSGLPISPVTTLSVAPAAKSGSVLVAGTFGRGLWQIPLLARVTVAPNLLDFGTQTFGGTSAAKTVTLTNATGDAVVTGTISVTGDFAETGSCANTTVSPGASCTVNVTFSPTQPGTRNGQLSIQVNGTADGPLTVSLTGSGGKCTTVICLYPSSADLGQVEVGFKSDKLQITAENGGATPVAITSLTISGPFVLTSNVCGTTQLVANSDCQLMVQFQPTISGPASGALTLVDTEGTHSVQLTGIGLSPPTDILSTASLVFPDTIIGQRSAAQLVTLTNKGDVNLTNINAPFVTGPFAVSSDCNGQVPAHSQCHLSVFFIPTQPGAQSGTLTVSDILNAGQTVTLTGSGLVPPATGVVQIAPAQVNFPVTGIGATSNPVTLTIVNANTGPLTNLVLKVSSGFQIVSNTCGQSLAANASCAAGVVFAPTSLGPQSGTFAVSSKDLSADVTAHLSGTGFDFTVTSSGLSSVTVSSGQTASFTLILTPSSGMGGTFTFQCGTLPAYASCAFNPSTETVAAGTTGTAIVQVMTSQGTTAEARPPASYAPRAWPVVLAFIALPVAWRRRFSLVLVCLLATLGISGCSSSGGGGGGTPSSPTAHTTPAGTYSIPVTVSASGVQHVVTLTLVVD